MRHVRDIRRTTAVLIREMIEGIHLSADPQIIDIGCGDGWFLRLLEDEDIAAKYVGIDFNPDFISAMHKRYEGVDGREFLLHDIELPLPTSMQASFHIAVDFFNFFEVPNVPAAMKNVADALLRGGRFLIVSIDPVLQMLAVTNTREEMKQVLSLYEAHPNTLGYDKDIDVGDAPSGRIYKSLFYSPAFYVSLAHQNGLRLYDYKECVKTGNYVPQTYQFLLFEK